MSSESSFETPPPEPALSTPHLKAHDDFNTIDADQTLSSIAEKKQPSVFDIAQDMQEQLKKASEFLDKNDKEMNERIDGLLKTIDHIHKSSD
ncbi:uncharacterized protein SPAPADRAFT_59097 [Spathaspora passalidarum NRRL Y-27907]|uniref:Uncharacterized protein n=1 Tax=Spathaspora passalidarum (strain NRRL Y-27907 / 11-Y1) TaxID=619300 RepID=G3AIL9_SPAPN|nr:uncharacterized protein SPAPADRAFT_59097 [Spathaspora passalidarum NRRL Y-27907]EGW33734.1 hypothetical protein SPAPADRAFT_59097 [Spathaspora passalidarum NRRL Y-27907]